MIRRPPRSTLDRSSAASDVYKRQALPGGAVTDGEDDPRARCGFDAAAQRLSEVAGRCAGDGQNVGVPGRGDEPGTVALGVVDRSEGARELDLTPVA